MHIDEEIDTRGFVTCLILSNLSPACRSLGGIRVAVLQGAGRGWRRGH